MRSVVIAGDEEAAREALREIAPDKRVQCVLSLPRAEGLLRWAVLPTAQPRQVAQMVMNEAATQSPWPADDTCVGFECFPSDPGYSRVLVFMARQGAITERLERLRGWGLTPARVEFSTVSLARLLGENERARNAALCLARRDGCEYLRLSDGIPVFSRGTIADETPIEMLRKSVELDRRRNGREAGTAPLLVAAEEVPVEPLQREAGALGFSVVAAEDIHPEPAAWISAGAAMGAVAAAGTSNLLPARERRRHALRRLGREARVLAVGCVWLVAALAGFCHQAFEAERRVALAAKQEIGRLEQEAGDLVAHYEQLKLLTGERTRVALPLRLVLNLYELTPPDVAVVQMVYDERGTLVLGGEAPGYAGVFAYLTALGKSPYLRDVRLLHSSKPRSSKTSLIEFKVQATVSGEVPPP